MKKILIIVALLITLTACQMAMDHGMMMDSDEASFEFGEPTMISEPSKIVELAEGESFSLEANIVQHAIDGALVTGYAYNGMLPGPLLKLQQGSRVQINFTNTIDQPTTVHWHGLRHDITDDGMPGVSQDPTLPGESHEYTLFVPDSGLYWYHPHIREDIQQDAGLYGMILVEPADEEYYNPANREEVLVLDDVLFDGSEIIPFGLEHANYATMGRFGSVLLVNGGTDYSLEVQRGEVVRFYVANVANVRPFNLSIEGVQFKLVGSDLSRYEQDEWVESVVIAPAQRYIVEAYFPTAGAFELLHTSPHGESVLGKVVVREELIAEHLGRQFVELSNSDTVQADIASFAQWYDKPIDYTIDLVVELGHSMEGMDHGAMNHVGEDGIEWEDPMAMMNAHTTSEEVEWILQNAETGEQNTEFALRAVVGDKLKMRLRNPLDSDHPMQHPIHLHGQRFIVLSIDGQKVENKVWKDTVLVPAGSEVDILVDVTNPGEWMLHCHIAEHLEAGMKTKFIVTEV